MRITKDQLLYALKSNVVLLEADDSPDLSVLVVRVAPGEVVTVRGTPENIARHRRFIEMHRDCERPVLLTPQTSFGNLAGGPQ